MTYIWYTFIYMKKITFISLLYIVSPHFCNQTSAHVDSYCDTLTQDICWYKLLISGQKYVHLTAWELTGTILTRVNMRPWRITVALKIESAACERLNECSGNTAFMRTSMKEQMWICDLWLTPNPLLKISICSASPVCRSSSFKTDVGQSDF